MNTSDNKETTRTEIHTIGEFGLIDKVVKPFSIVNKSTLKGIGDDAAVIDNEGFKTVVSTDMLIEGIHFDLMYHPLKHLGYKAVVVNLSDIYAMNAIPKQIFVSIGISNRFSVEAVEELYWGIKKACERYGVDLAGGDTTSSPRGLVLSITAVGQGLQEKLVPMLFDRDQPVEMRQFVDKIGSNTMATFSMIKSSLDEAIRCGDLEAKSSDGVRRHKGSSIRPTDFVGPAPQRSLIFLP